jgi:hypothetical protein
MGNSGMVERRSILAKAINFYIPAGRWALRMIRWIWIPLLLSAWALAQPVITENLVCSGSRSAGVAEEVSKGTVKLETAEQGLRARKAASAKTSWCRDEIWSWLANSPL